MIQTLIVCGIFAFLYALKGGSGSTLFPWWKKFRETNKITERLLDGKVISTLGAFLFALLFNAKTVSLNGGAFGVPEYTVQTVIALLFALGWLASVAPSMGEEHGAVGRWGNSWGEYVTKGFGRKYGVKKALQRGVWIGACMVLATGFIPYLYFSLLFVPCVFIGQELGYRVTGKEGWALAEPIIGGFVYGIATSMWI